MNISRSKIKGVLQDTPPMVVLSLILVALTACAPITTTFYRPDSDTGKVVKAWCPPVHSFLLIETHDVIVGFKVSSIDKGRMLATITFEIPENHHVKMIDHFVEINGLNQISSKGELSAHTWVAAGRTEKIAIDRPMQGYTKKRIIGQTTLYGKTEHAYFFLHAEIDAAPSERISLKPPSFEVDGVRIELPVIEFTKTEETFAGSLNC